MHALPGRWRKVTTANSYTCIWQCHHRDVVVDHDDRKTGTSRIVQPHSDSSANGPRVRSRERIRKAASIARLIDPAQRRPVDTDDDLWRACAHADCVADQPSDAGPETRRNENLRVQATPSVSLWA